MPTVVDSLIVTLGLDPSGFTQGSKQAAEALLKTRNQSATVAKEMEASGKRAAAFFSQLRNQALLLFAVLAGGRGLKQFISDTTASSAALGKMAVYAGATVEQLSKWRGIATATGGSADGVASSINGLNQALVRLSLTGESEIIPYFRALQAAAPAANLSLADANGNMRTAIDLLPELHKAVQGMDGARATALLTGMGIGQDLINILLAEDKAFNKFMADQKRWGTVTKEQALAAQKFQYAMAGVEQSFTTLGRIMLTQVSPYLERIMTRLTDLFVWFQSHPKEMEKAFWAIVAVVTALGVAFGGPITMIGLLAAAIALLYNDWSDYNETGKSDFWKFMELVKDGWDAIAEKASNKWREIAAVVGPGMTALGQSLKAALVAVFEYFFDMYDNMGKNWSNVLGAMRTVWNNLWEGMSTAIVNAGPKIYDAVKHAFGSAFGWAITRANTVWKALTGHDLVGPDSETSAADKEAAAKVGGASGKLDPAKREQQEEDIQYLMRTGGLNGEGWSREKAVGIYSNVMGESAGDPNAKENGGAGPGRGLAQWTDPARKRKFKEIMGVDVEGSSRKQQLDFINWELRNTHRAAGEALARSKSYNEATDAVLDKYEIPDEKNRARDRQIRRAFAVNLMTPPVAPPAPVGGGAAAAAAANVSSGIRLSAPSNSSSISIGEINIHTQATDAAGISRDVKSALDERFESAQANYGQL